MHKLLISLLLLSIFAVAKHAAPVKPIHSGQSVYIVAVDTTHRDLSMTRENLELERRATEQFKKEDKFKIAKGMRDADIVFFVALDEESRDWDEVAIAVLRTDYTEGTTLDKLRQAALWQESSRYKTGKHAGVAAATMGFSGIFDHASVVKDLVKKFHRDNAN